MLHEDRAMASEQPHSKHPSTGLKPFAGFMDEHALPAAGRFSLTFRGWGRCSGITDVHL